MLIKIILGIIAIVSGLTALKEFHSISSMQQIHSAFNSLIFVVCLGFINISPKNNDSENKKKNKVKKPQFTNRAL